MKKFFILLILIGSLAAQGYTQPTASITVENPRIIGSQFYFDVYFERTNDNAGWYYFLVPGVAALGNSSWWFTLNTSALNNPALVYEDPTYLQGIYTNLININLGKIALTTTLSALPTHLPLNVMFHAYTIRCDITNALLLSQVNWDALNTGLVTWNSGAISVTETVITSGCNILLNTKCWTGASNGDWNDASNWSPSGIPTATDDIIYPNNPTNELSAFNSIAVHKVGEVNNLRINHFGEMHIIQNMGLVVNGDASLYGGTNLVLEASTSPINDSIYSSAFLPEGSIDYSAYSIEDGHIEVHRTLDFDSTASSYYMHQVAAPVSGVILGDWDMQVLSTYAFEWRTATQEWYNIYAPSRSTPPGYGFVISLGGQIGPSTRDLVFTDNLVLTDQVINFDAIQSGENALIGNPYTAPIDWDLMLAGQSNVSTTCYVWNPLGGNYVTYVAGTGGHLSAKRIQPGQSFFIDATGAVSSFSIDLADRVAYIEPYMKESGYPYLLNLYTEGGNGSSDEIYIRFKEDDGVSPAYDQLHDGMHKLPEYVNFATELYTVTSDGIDLAVDARPMLVGDDVSVALAFKPAEDGEYKIHADDASMNSFPPSISIMLEDKFEPQQDWIDLRAEGSYTFEAEKYDPRDRFVIHFYDLEFGLEEGPADPIRIYSDRTDAFIINNSEQLIKEIHVYDITGNLMLSRSTVNDASTRIYVSDKVGYYVVKVITDKAVYSEKVLITK